MTHEISQLDIPDTELQKISAQPRVSISREIGEATVTHTIFGRAKVRIVRKHDNLRRGLELIVLVVLVVLAVAAWQAWLASQATAPLPSPDSPSAVSVPAPLPEAINPPAAVSPAENAPAQPEADKPAIMQKSAPQPGQGEKGGGPAFAAPIAPKALTASRAQPAPMTLSTPPLRQPAKSPPAPVAMPHVPAAPAAQPAASSPPVVVPLASPLGSGAPQTMAPAADRQPADPISTPAR